MHARVQPYLLAVLVGACSQATPSVPQAAATNVAAARTVYVSLTPKHQVRRFLNRLASPSGHLVVTQEPVAGALASERLTVTGAERLMLVELNPDVTRPLPGERLRLGGFAVVAIPYGRSPHAALGDHRLYAEDLGDREIRLPESRTPRDPTWLKPTVGERVAPVDIDPAFLEARLREFSGAIPVSIGGRTVTIAERRSETGRADARAFLKQEYERLGFTTSEHRYGSGLSAGANFIAERAGSEPERVVLLTAHLDSVGNAGADDDGAGTISALAIAQALKDQPLRYTLRVVGFDQEESGLVGSAAYAQSLSAAGTINQIVGVFNVEMTGYDSDDDGAFHSIDCGENTSSDLTALITGVVARDPLRLQLVDACTNRSDHASFWRYDVPAIVVSENFFGGDGNPCYHSACDRVDQINFAYMTRVTTAIGRALADLVVAAR